MELNQYHYWMAKALEQAKRAGEQDEIPIGALVVDENGALLSSAFNQKERTFDPCAHAEVIAMQMACEGRQNWRLKNCTLFTTLEPCPMCMSVMVHARIERLVFGAYDLKGGALGLGYLLHADQRLNHRFSVIGGIMADESSLLLRSFFAQKRLKSTP